MSTTLDLGTRLSAAASLFILSIAAFGATFNMPALASQQVATAYVGAIA